MNKSSLFIAAGAAVILCGCSTTPVAGTKPVIPAPVEDPQPIETPATINADDTKLAPGPRQSQAPVFEPMTGVTSSGGVDSAPAKGKRTAQNAKTGKVVAAGGSYIVKSGDTPERIARKHGVRLSALMAANNLTQQSARRLQIGQKLIIPGKDVAPEVKPQVNNDPEVVVPPVPNSTDVTVPPVVQPESATTGTTTTDNTVVEQPAVTGTIDAVDAESEIEMRTIEENTTAAELAAKYNVSAEVISEKNSGKTEFVKGDLIFIPKK